MAILIALLLSFSSPTTLPIDLAASDSEICALSEQGGAAMVAEVVHLHVVRVVTHLGESLYLKRKVVVELCSTHLQRIIYGIDLHYSVYVCQQDIYWLIYPFRH